MKQVLPIGILILTVLAQLVSLSAQSVPSLVNYQGRLTDQRGSPVSGNVHIAVEIHSHETQDAAVYRETIGTVPVNNGIYSFQFGARGGFATALENPEAWLEVSVDSRPLTPRQRLIAVPYAMRSAALGSVLAEDTRAPVAGMIRWTGREFEGYDGTNWLPLSTPRPLVTPVMVGVGNRGNADDPEPNGLGGNSGSVLYDYSIGKYEVTNAEYVEFLNAVDPGGLNELALYNTSMSFDNSAGGITFTAGNAGGLKYAVKNGFASKPVVHVSVYDAMRFCNWLHNGARPEGDTENGAYTLIPPVDPANGVPSNGDSVVRNSGAKFALPTEDEWYKAAYHQPQTEGGDSDDYWAYPTGSNTVPNFGNPPGTAPAANFGFMSGVNATTTVGAYTTTEGFYGTFDMAGNAFEWTETRSGSLRVLRGGSWLSGGSSLKSDAGVADTPSDEGSNGGFRIVSL